MQKEISLKLGESYNIYQNWDLILIVQMAGRPNRTFSTYCRFGATIFFIASVYLGVWPVFYVFKQKGGKAQ